MKWIFYILSSLGGAALGLGASVFLFFLWEWHSLQGGVNYAAVACYLLLAIGLMVMGIGITVVNNLFLHRDPS
mgnify:CR=1 FL=1